MDPYVLNQPKNLGFNLTCMFKDMMGPMNMPHSEKQMGGRPFMPSK